MFQKTVTDNGLRIITRSMPHTQAVSITLYVGAGSRYETEDIAGISHFVEHMCFKGTRSRPTAKEISETIEGVGGILNAATDRELTFYWCKVPLPQFRIALDVLVDMILEPTFDPDEIEKERAVILEELAMTYDVPSYRADLLIDEVMWPEQPLGRDVGGTRDSVSSINRDMLIAYKDNHYVASNIVVSIAGNIEHDEVVDAVKLLFRGKLSVGHPTQMIKVQDTQTRTSMKLETRKSEQANICIGFKGVSATHHDRYPLDLLSAVLGDGMSSRLFLELREEQGLVYDVHTTSSHLKDCGSFITYAGVEPSKVYKAITLILEEFQLIKNGVSQQELHKAKEFLKGRLTLRLEDSRAIASWAGAQELLQDRILDLGEVLGEVDKVTSEDIERVAKELLVAEKLSLAVVGPYRSERKFHKALKI